MFFLKGPGFDDRSGRSSGQHSRGPGCTLQVSQLLELYHETPGIIQGAISEKKLTVPYFKVHSRATGRLGAYFNSNFFFYLNCQMLKGTSITDRQSCQSGARQGNRSVQSVSISGHYFQILK